MTTLDRYGEVEIKLCYWEAACYWCGKIFSYRSRKAHGWREHINIEHEPKMFCCKQCKLDWIYAKQVYGELMP